MRIGGVRSALAYQFNQDSVQSRAAAQSSTFTKPEPAQDKGIIIVGGKPQSSVEERAIIIVGGKPQSSLEERGIIIVGGKPDTRFSTMNGILFAGGRSVIR
jgi:hypothetical protein